MKRIFFLLAGVTALLPARGQTLEQCRRMARENYPLIKQRELTERSKELNLSNAARGWLPQLSITGIGGIVQGMPSLTGGSSSGVNQKVIGLVQLTQPIWDGGISSARKKMAEAQADVDQATLEAQLARLDEQVNQLYLGVLMLDCKVRTLELADSTLGANQKRVEVALSNGAATASDRDALIAERLGIKQQMIEAQAARRAYLEVLGEMAGVPMGGNVQLSRPAMPLGALPTGIRRLELDVYDSQGDLIKAQNKMITTRLMPQVGLTGFAVGLAPGMDLGMSKLNHILVAGISLKWDIGGLYTKNNDRGLLKLSQSQVELQRETFLYNTRLDMSRSRGDMEASSGQLKEDGRIVELRESVRKATEIKYENGTATVADLVRETNSEAEAKCAKELHELQYILQYENYKSLTGNQQ